MKIRIKDNTVRLRLSQSEVEIFTNHGKVTRQIRFGPDQEQALKYTLKKTDGHSVEAEFSSNQITIVIPNALADQWSIDPARISIKDQIDIGLGEVLEILVEKDFQCLSSRPGEDESDLFPHPKEDIEKC